MLRDALLIFKKDLAIERRSRESLFTMVTFALLSTVIFALGFYVDDDKARAYGPGILWVVVLFSGTLGLQRLFDAERENDCLAGLLLSPADPRGLFLGKVMVQLVFSGIMEALTVPLVFLFFGLFELSTPAGIATIAAILVLGTIGFAFIGTLFAATLVSTRLREVLLPIVVYPLASPIFIAGVQSTRSLLSGESPADVSHWILLMVAFDLIYAGVCAALFPVLIRD